jgi:NADH dehydrogenase/NADH:ubiquinone oxidoreductase subunit G
LLKRKSKTSNLHGLEKLGLKPFKGLPGGTTTALIFRGGRAELPTINGVKMIGVGVFMKDEANQFDVVLPSLSFAEKDGTVVNFQGKEQAFQRAISPVGESLALAEILMMWAHHTSSKTGAA